MNEIRHDWSKEEIQAIYDRPLLDLVYSAATVHRKWHKPSEIQVCTLLSVKTGGCPEDCSYCGQAARYHTDIKVQSLLPTETVIEHAQKAKENSDMTKNDASHGEKSTTLDPKVKGDGNTYEGDKADNLDPSINEDAQKAKENGQ